MGVQWILDSYAEPGNILSYDLMLTNVCQYKTNLLQVRCGMYEVSLERFLPGVGISDLFAQGLMSRGVCTSVP